MAELVRVKLENGAEATVPASVAKKHNLDVLDKPATRQDGRALPAKPKTSVAKKTASSTSTPAGSTTSASSKEESK